MRSEQPSDGRFMESRNRSLIAVCPVAEIPVGEVRRVPCAPPVAIFNVDGDFYAVDDTCTHQDTSLSDGWLEGCEIECPLHSSRFDLRTGKPNQPPATRALRTHEVRIVDGIVYLSMSEAPA